MKPAILDRLRGVQKAGPDKWLAFCPAHPDQKRRSLSVAQTGGKTLLHCFVGCASDAIVAAVRMTLADLFSEPGVPPTPSPQIIATYDYHDERGTLLFQVCRLEPKDFRMRRPDGAGWTWNVKDVRRVVHRLHELAEAERVYLVEGEKDADRLVSLGLRATTSPGGAKGWRRDYAEQIARARRRGDPRSRRARPRLRAAGRGGSSGGWRGGARAHAPGLGRA